MMLDGSAHRLYGSGSTLVQESLVGLYLREAAELGAFGKASAVPSLWSTWYLACIQLAVNMAPATQERSGVRALVSLCMSRMLAWEHSQDTVSTYAMHLPDVDQILLSYTTLAEWSNSSGIGAPRVQVSV